MTAESQVTITFGTPGSGKTTEILEQLAQLGKTGVGSNEVLVVVPNRRSASLLRDRALLSFNKAGGSDLVRTLPSIAFEIVQNSAASRGEPSPTLLSGAGQAALLRELLDSEFGKSLRSQWALPSVTLELPSFLSELRDLVSICQQHSVAPERIIDIGRQGNRGAIVAAGRLLGEYRNILAERNLVDPQQLISRASQLLSTQPEYQLPVKHLFVDDAQEFSSAELGLIAQLASGAKLEVFADPDATVLGFRAAAPEELQRILGASMPVLRRDLMAWAGRPAPLAALMSRVATKIPTALGGTHRAGLVAEPSQAAVSQFRIFNSTAAESDYLADLIRQLKVREGRDWSQIVVVLRTRSQIDQLSAALSQHGIPVRVPTAQSALAGFGIAGDLLRLILRAAELDTLDRPKLELLLGSRLSQLDALDVRSLKRRLSVEPEGVVAAVTSLLLEQDYDELKGSAAAKARKFGKLLRLASTADHKRPHELISEIWSELSLESRLLRDSWMLSEVGFASHRDLDSMVELVGAATRYSEQNPAASALDFARWQSQLQVVEDSLAKASMLSSVQLVTPAGLIGQRAPVVIVPRLQEGIWPNLRPRNSLLAAASIEAFLRGAQEDPLTPTRSELEHELRSFYKAIGAASEAVYISAVQLEDEAPSQFFSFSGWDLGEPEGYRRELDVRARVATLRQKLKINPSKEVATVLAAYAHLGAPGAHPATWYGSISYTSGSAIAQPESGPVVSPSQLQKFAECPLHWFISTYGGEGKGFEASVGTLLHEALEMGDTGFDQLWAIVESKWGQLNIESEWQNQAERRRAIAMVGAMAEYLNQVSDQSILNLEREKFISEKVYGLEVRGTIDRLEQLPDGRLRVVDLKTGHVGTKADVAANLQLALYQMLVEIAYPAKPLAGAMILGVKGGKLSQVEQPPLSAEFRKEIELLFEKARKEFPGPSFGAALASHCSAPGSICSILLAPEVHTHG